MCVTIIIGITLLTYSQLENKSVDPGLAQSSCTTALQSLINAANANTTINVPPCIYRETITINKPLTVNGQGKAEIRGSTIWTGWTKSGAYWTKGVVPAFFTNDHTCGRIDNSRYSGDSRKTDQCNWQEQVFIDGKELEQVNANPRVGEFMINSARQILLVDDPTNHTVEVTTRQRWVNITASNVKITGFIMKHSANPSQYDALHASSVNNISIENSNLTYAHGPILGLHLGSGNIIRNNEIAYSGHLGIAGNRTTGELIQGNNIHNNNTQLVSCEFECGGVKVARATGIIIENNESYQNYGYGLWCDIDCNNVTIRNNRVHDNDNKGIVQEISYSAIIYGNAVWNNGFQYKIWGWGAGILAQNSKGVEIYNNTIAWNADGTGIIGQDRGIHSDVSNNYIHDNTIIANEGYSIFYLGDFLGSNNRASGNKYYNEGNASNEWTGIGNILLTKAQVDLALKTAGIPLSPGIVITPRPSITPTPTATPSPITSPSPTPTALPTPSPSRTPSPSPSISPTLTPTPIADYLCQLTSGPFTINSPVGYSFTKSCMETTATMYSDDTRFTFFHLPQSVNHHYYIKTGNIREKEDPLLNWSINLTKQATVYVLYRKIPGQQTKPAWLRNNYQLVTNDNYSDLQQYVLRKNDLGLIGLYDIYQSTTPKIGIVNFGPASEAGITAYSMYLVGIKPIL